MARLDTLTTISTNPYFILATLSLIFFIILYSLLGGGTTGNLIWASNPPITDPSPPGLVWAIRTSGEEIYYLWVENDFLWSDADLQEYGTFAEGQRVKVTGDVEKKYDLNGLPFNIIHVEKIEDT